MHLKVKFSEEIIQFEKENKKVARRRLSLGRQIKKVSDLREKLIEEMVFEILASRDFEKEEVRFIQLPIGKNELLKELIMRSEYVANISGQYKHKDSCVGVSKVRLRTVCGIDKMRYFIKNINFKLVDFDIRISVVGETVQKYSLQII